MRRERRKRGKGQGKGRRGHFNQPCYALKLVKYCSYENIMTMMIIIIIIRIRITNKM